jgi:hypothetical protein
VRFGLDKMRALAPALLTSAHTISRGLGHRGKATGDG